VPAPAIVTFDCYRTLIDFDLEGATRGIISDRLASLGVEPDDFMRDFSAMRFQAVVQEYRPYREVVQRSLRAAMLLHGLPYRESDAEELLAAIAGFTPFPEVPEALRRLRVRYKLAIITNSDDDLIGPSVSRLGVDFDHVITAEQSRAYKPLPEAFDYALRAIGCRPDEVAHAAQGWEYDIMPTARYAGMRRVWVNRFGRRGSAAFAPYDEIRDLSELPPLLGA
jgi:2-haloacid dehalogenase